MMSSLYPSSFAISLFLRAFSLLKTVCKQVRRYIFG